MDQIVEQMLEKWGDALESYGTPRDFADKTYAYYLRNSENLEELPIRAIVAPGFAGRRELMAKQRQETEARKTLDPTQRWKNDGDLCFLCDNLGQAEDIGDNLILPWDTFDDYAIVPNRYPSVRGASLLCRKQHNNEDNNSITEDYLEMMIEVSEKYGFGVLRNHPFAGMSIPGHEHVQMHPKTVPKKGGGEVYFNGLRESELSVTEYAEDIYSANGTRFDTLAFKGNKLIEKVLGTIGNFKNDNIIFTFSYEPSEKDFEGVLFLAPHIKEDEEKRVGGGTHMYLDVVVTEGQTEFEDWISIREQFLYKKGEFEWGQVS